MEKNDLKMKSYYYFNLKNKEKLLGKIFEEDLR
jgi:hypothetical protein